MWLDMQHMFGLKNAYCYTIQQQKPIPSIFLMFFVCTYLYAACLRVAPLMCIKVLAFIAVRYFATFVVFVIRFVAQNF